MRNQPDRRRTPRTRATGPIDVRLVSRDIPLRLVDIGEGGCLVSGSSEIRPIGRIDLLFGTPDDSWRVALTGRLVHSHLRTVPGRRPEEWVMGVAFLDTHDADVKRRIGELIERATAAGAPAVSTSRAEGSARRARTATT